MFLVSIIITSFNAQAKNTQVKFKIIPLNNSTVIAFADSIETIVYTVTNQLPTPVSLAMTIMQGVTQITNVSGACQIPIVLNPGASCSLTLAVQGNQFPRGQTTTIRNSPQICIRTSQLSCSQPYPADWLKVSIASDTIGGTISGLTTNGLVLQNNGGNNLTVPANSNVFQFPTPVAAGSTYNVTVHKQPRGLMCTVSNGSGIVTASVTNIKVSCTTATFSISVTVSGLASSVTGFAIENNGSDVINPTNNGKFTFPTMVPYGGTYDITVLTQPTGGAFFCTPSHGQGTVTGPINVNMICNSTNVPISINVTGLTSSVTGFVVANNTHDQLNPTTNGVFTFSQPVSIGGTYDITVPHQPPGYTCTPTNGQGTASAPVTVDMICNTISYPIGGTTTGLTLPVTGFVLLNNGHDELMPINNGPFTFSQPIASGGTYHVTVKTQPDGFICSISNSSGTAAAPVTNVTVTCASSGYVVSNDPFSSTNSVSQCSILSTGQLSNCSPTAIGAPPFLDLVLTPGNSNDSANSYAYASPGLSNNIYLCNIDPITANLTCPSTTGSNFNGPEGIAINPSGTHVYVTNFNANTVTLCTAGSGGTLTNCSSTGSGFDDPNGITIHPNNQYAYVTNYNVNNSSVILCKINSINGTLSNCSSTGSGFSQPDSIAIAGPLGSPSTYYAYVSNQNSSTVSLCKVSSTTGSLTNCNNTGTGFNQPSNIVINSANTLAYIANTGNNNVLLCAIESTSGNLTNCSQTGPSFDNPLAVALPIQ